MRGKKVLLWLAIVVIVLILAVKFGENYAEKHFSNRVIPIEDKVSIIIGDIDISIMSAGVVLNDVRLIDTLSPAVVGRVDRVAVLGIRWLRLITGDGFSMRGLKVEGVDCELNLDRLKTDTSSVASFDSIGAKSGVDMLDSVEGIDTINKMLYLSASLVHIRFDEDMQADLRTLEINHVKYRPNQGKYDVDLGSITSSHGLQMIEIDSFQLIPRYPKYEFGFQAGRRMASIDILIEKIKIQRFDLKALTRDSMISIESIVCERGFVYVFSDKRVAIDMDRYGPLPHEALLNSSNRIAIDSIIAKDVDVRYASVNPHTMEEGYLDFKRSYVSLYNITNVAERIEQNRMMTVDLHSRFTNEGELDAHFDFDLTRKDYQFVWHGTLGRMKLGNIDSFVLPIVNMHITDGYCHGLKFHIVSDYDTSRGTLQFQYTNLKVMAMDAKRKKNLKFVSGLANIFVVYSNNLVGNKNFYEGKIHVGRRMYRGFPDYVWTSLENGILYTILPDGIAKSIEKQPAKAVEKEEKKDERVWKKAEKRAKRKEKKGKD
jgi:hypothetical protein